MKALTAEMAVWLDQPDLTPIIFIAVEFDGRTDRYCTAAVDVPWDGETWYGVGGVVGIAPISESDSLEAHGVQFVIAGLSQSETASFFLDNYQGRRCSIWFGLIADGDAGVVNSPVLEFRGLLDAPRRNIAPDGEVALVIPVESRMARWAIPSGARYTNAEQKRRNAGDDLFRDVAQLAESVELKWPKREYFL